jgi:hypothetical protein
MLEVKLSAKESRGCEKGLIGMKDVKVIAKLADLQEVGYQNTLLLHALVELLEAKGLLKKDELIGSMHGLDAELQHRIEQIAGLSSVPCQPPVTPLKPGP